MIPYVPAGEKPPPIHWWGNVFYRCWASDDGEGYQQLVIVIRLPWWWKAYCINTDHMKVCQRVVSWRAREGWRAGWL